MSFLSASVEEHLKKIQQQAKGNRGSGFCLALQRQSSFLFPNSGETVASEKLNLLALEGFERIVWVGLNHFHSETPLGPRSEGDARVFRIFLAVALNALDRHIRQNNVETPLDRTKRPGFDVVRFLEIRSRLLETCEELERLCPIPSNTSQ